VVAHLELHRLAIGHIDCDAFYASVEKARRPDLAGRPVIVGGDDHRGVVAACCYVARMAGVRSAMPIHRALERCADAVVLPPDMAAYKAIGLRARAIMTAFTACIEPIALDEAYLDLADVRTRLSISPAQALVEIVRRFESDLGITASIGLGPNKLLAKIASDLDKPRGFAVIGQTEAIAFLAPRPVTLLWGVGPALARRLGADGIARIGDILDREEIWMVRRYGAIGRSLHRFARGQDDRRVEPASPARSISAETTFDWDIADLPALVAALRPLAESVARRMKAARMLGRSVVIKLKTADFRQSTRSRRVDPPTAAAGTIMDAGRAILEHEADGRAFRLVGIGCTDLVHPDAEPDLFA
jgi:DNA polymerase-4